MMWKQYDELNESERAAVATIYSADASQDVRRLYGYWVESGFVQCRKIASQVKWNEKTLY